jgi:hypothetical protein
MTAGTTLPVDASTDAQNGLCARRKIFTVERRDAYRREHCASVSALTDRDEGLAKNAVTAHPGDVCHIRPTCKKEEMGDECAFCVHPELKRKGHAQKRPSPFWGNPSLIDLADFLDRVLHLLGVFVDIALEFRCVHVQHRAARIGDSLANCRVVGRRTRGFA